MAKTVRIKWPPQKLRLIISGLTGQKILQFDWWVVIDEGYIIVKEFYLFLKFGHFLYCSKTAQIMWSASWSFCRIYVKKHNLSINCVCYDAIYLSCHLNYERLARYISVRRNKPIFIRTLCFYEKIWGSDSCTCALVHCIYSMTEYHRSIIWFRTSPLFQSKGEYSTTEGVSGANGHGDFCPFFNFRANNDSCFDSNTLSKIYSTALPHDNRGYELALIWYGGYEFVLIFS